MKVYGQLQFAQLHVRASDPTPATQALIWYNSTSNVVRLDNGSGILELVDTSTVQTLSSKVLSSPTLNGAISGDAFLDEDDFSSNANDKVASQQSIKAYVDAVTTVVKPNKLHNYNMRWWQRGTSFTTTNVYTADRIKARSAGSAFTVSRQTSSDTNKKYKLRIISNASQAYVQIGSQVEYGDFQDLTGKTVTFKYRGAAVNSNTASTNHNVAFYYSTTEDASIAWGGGGAIGIGSTAKVFTTSNADYSVSFTIPATAKSLWWQIGAESSPVSGDGFEIENVMLFEGSIDQDFISSTNSEAEQVGVLQRYYEKSHDLETHTTTGVSWVSTLKHVGNNQYPQLFNTAKRVSPTMTVRNSSTGTSAEVRNDSASTNLTANFTLSKERGFSLHILGGASAEGQQVSCSWYADSEF